MLPGGCTPPNPGGEGHLGEAPGAAARSPAPAPPINDNRHRRGEGGRRWRLVVRPGGGLRSTVGAIAARRRLRHATVICRPAAHLRFHSDRCRRGHRREVDLYLDAGVGGRGGGVAGGAPPGGGGRGGAGGGGPSPRAPTRAGGGPGPAPAPPRGRG